MNVIVTPYDPAWPLEFAKEATLLGSVLGTELLEVHHIGSTAVRGLEAKPVIDMLPVVRDIARIDDLGEALLQIGYEGLGENGLPGRRYFRKGGDDRTHQAHIYAAGHPDIERHLAFRDYLRAHPEAAREYGELKARLAALYPRDIESYCQGKDAFIRQHEARALLWQRGTLKAGH